MPLFRVDITKVGRHTLYIDGATVAEADRDAQFIAADLFYEDFSWERDYEIAPDDVPVLGCDVWTGGTYGHFISVGEWLQPEGVMS